MMKTQVFAMKPPANQMERHYGDTEVRQPRPTQTFDEPSTIEKTVKRFVNSSVSKGDTEQQSIEFRDPVTKQVFLRASVHEAEANMKRLSLIISENEQETTLLRHPQDSNSNS